MNILPLEVQPEDGSICTNRNMLLEDKIYDLKIHFIELPI
jgi:hypothetical protein